MASIQPADHHLQNLTNIRKNIQRIQQYSELAPETNKCKEQFNELVSRLEAPPASFDKNLEQLECSVRNLSEKWLKIAIQRFLTQKVINQTWLGKNNKTTKQQNFLVKTKTKQKLPKKKIIIKYY